MGGSEAAARGYCENLVKAGHDVTVITSCAMSHHDWANELPIGVEIVNGVTVHRLPVAQPRTEENFSRVHRRAMSPIGRINRSEARLWLSRIGPDLVGYERWLDDNAPLFDAALVMTYMYPTTTRALPLLRTRCPAVLIPTAHDEHAFHLAAFRSLFRLPDAFGFLTPEERDLVISTFEPRAHHDVIGVGIESIPPLGSNDFHQRFGLGNDPYVIIIGRVDALKGTYEALEMFRAFKARHPGPLKLVIVGERTESTTEDVITTGFCSEVDKHRAITGAAALIQPSYMESFSIVLCEAWLHSIPVIVNGHCDVTSGQVDRAHGGVTYRSYSEFEAALRTVLECPESASNAGANGARYVADNYSWPAVTKRIEVITDHAITNHQRQAAGVS